ncbi:MAG: trypsin-like peptidase domain-containing protein [Kiritimatiellia bacterium]
MNTLHRISFAALLAATPVAADEDVKAAPTVSADDTAGIPASVVAKVDPSVVAIKHERAQGSGFILTADGYIISNGHVVRGEDPEDPLLPAESITVQLFDDRMFRATVVGFWMDPDVSLLKIDPDTPLAPAELADSRAVRTGQRCFAVGNPKGLKRTYTGGLISNIERTDLGTEVPVLQTDAAINPGNSGGPLFDMEGRVIGINTYALTQSNNLGFTIPTHVLMAVQERIAMHGRFVRGELGNLLVREMDNPCATTGVKSGLMVHYVEPRAAAKAGLRSGDVITGVDGSWSCAPARKPSRSTGSTSPCPRRAAN